MNSIVGILTLDIFIPDAHSLKEKRSVLQKLKKRTRNRFNVSIAETDYQDKWQRAQLTVATVSNEKIHLEKTLQAVERYIEDLSLGQAEILTINITYH